MKETRGQDQKARWEVSQLSELQRGVMNKGEPKKSKKKSLRP